MTKLDFDAARKERGLEPIEVSIDGANYRVNLPIPATVMLKVAALFGDVDFDGLSDAAALKRMPDLVNALATAEPFTHFIHKLDVTEIVDLIRALQLMPDPERLPSTDT